MVENYLAELKDLGLIEYDEGERIYRLVGAKKHEYQSKHDYDLDLAHSNALVFSSEMKLRYDQMDPIAVADLLTCLDLNLNRDEYDEWFLQHVKTGYYADVYSLMQRYRQLLHELGLSGTKTYPKIALSEFHSKEIMSGKPKAKKDARKDKQEMGSYKRAKKLQEAFDLRNLLVGRIYAVVNDVRNGIPLEGQCEHCPKLRIEIKGRPP